MTQFPGPSGRRRRSSPVIYPSFNFLMIVALFVASGVVIAKGLVGGAGIALVFVFSGWVLIPSCARCDSRVAAFAEV